MRQLWGPAQQRGAAAPILAPLGGGTPLAVTAVAMRIEGDAAGWVPEPNAPQATANQPGDDGPPDDGMDSQPSDVSVCDPEPLPDPADDAHFIKDLLSHGLLDWVMTDEQADRISRGMIRRAAAV